MEVSPRVCAPCRLVPVVPFAVKTQVMIVSACLVMWRYEHQKLHEKHRGHEAMHAEMVLILIGTLIIAQIILVQWRQRHFQTYQVSAFIMRCLLEWLVVTPFHFCNVLPSLSLCKVGFASLARSICFSDGYIMWDVDYSYIPVHQVWVVAFHCHLEHFLGDHCICDGEGLSQTDSRHNTKVPCFV